MPLTVTKKHIFWKFKLIDKLASNIRLGIWSIRTLEFLNSRIQFDFCKNVVHYYCSTHSDSDHRVKAPCQEALRLTVRSDTIILRTLERKSNLFSSSYGYDHLSSSYFHLNEIGHEYLIHPLSENTFKLWREKPFQSAF